MTQGAMSDTTANAPHPLRRATDRAPHERARMRKVGLAWFFVMSALVALAGPLFVCFFALGVVSAFGLRWML